VVRNKLTEIEGNSSIGLKSGQNSPFLFKKFFETCEVLLKGSAMRPQLIYISYKIKTV